MSSTASELMPVGFRFHPTDEELISHYLKLKTLGLDSKVHHVIPEVDVCKFEPWDLPALSVVKSDDPEWFFFCPRGYKYSNSNRSNRATKAGYWKVTGKERLIKARATRTLIGKKRTLVFHKGRNPSQRTNWVMHEYYSVETFPDKRPFVICRLKEKPDEKNIHNADDGEPSSHIVPNSGSEEVHYTIPEVQDHSEVNLESFLQLSQQLDQNPFTQQPPMDTEQQIDFPFLNASSNACNEFPLSFEADEPDEDPTDFLNSILVDDDEYYFQETTHPLFNVSGQPFPLSLPADEVRGLHFLTPERSGSCSSFYEPVEMKKCLQRQRVSTPCGTSKLDLSKKDKNVSLHNQFSMQNSSSVSLTEDLHSIFCITLDANSTTEKPRKSEKPREPEKPRNPRSQPRFASRKIQMKNEGFPEAVSVNKAREAAAQNTAADLPQKEKPDAESKEGRKRVQDKSDCDVSPGKNCNRFFVFVETPCKSSPPSEYFFGALVGVLLFAAFVRETFLYANWC